MTFARFFSTSALALGVCATMPARADVVTVLTPTPLYTNAGPATFNDGFAFDTWLRENVRASSSIGITDTQPRSGTGSLEFGGSNGASKADLEYYFSSPLSLGDLTNLQYDWYRDGGSTNSDVQAPALRLYISSSGLTPFADGFLIFEPVYNNGSTAVPVNSWQTSVIGQNTNLWWRQLLPSGVTDENYNRTLAQWIAGQHDSGFATLGANSKVLGFSVGTGSGWNGSYSMFVDNISYKAGSADATTFNFETQSPVPEPSSWALMAAGVAGLLGRRKLRSSLGR